MEILEVRDGFVKFEKNEEIFLSSLVKIDGQKKSYIAQVLQIKGNIAIAKILYLYNGQLTEYDKSEPATDSDIYDFSSDILKEIKENNSPVIIGKFSNENIIVGAENFDKKAIVCLNNRKKTNILVQNFVRQFNNLNKNVVIIDSAGTIDAKKYAAGIDFKLPLDKNSLKFIYDECLNDATAESKALIVEIFKDLLDYAATVDYVPFKVLKTIVDDMVDKSHIFKLLVLKNKLAKFDRLGYFANDKKDIEKIHKIFASKCSIVDISQLDYTFMNRYLTYIYQNMSQNVQSIIELSSKMSKKTLKYIFDSSVSSLYISKSDYRYLKEIKNLCENFIIFPSNDIYQTFNEYKMFLKAMNKEEFLITGKFTCYIPFISVLQPIIETVLDVNDLDTDETIIPDNEIDFPEVINEPEEYSNQNDLNNDEENIIENIIEKSQNTISNIADTLEEPQNMEMFSEDNGQNTGIVDNNELDEIQESTVVNNEYKNGSESEVTAENGINEAILDEHQIEPDEYEYATVTHDSAVLEENTEESITEEDNNEQPDTDSQIEDGEIVIETDDLDDLDSFEDSLEPEISEEFEQVDTEDITEENEAVINEGNNYSEQNIESEEDVMTLNEEELSNDDFLELDSSVTNDNDILVEIDDDPVNIEDELDEQIKKDVDQVYTVIKDDEVSESDLDFIDEIKNDQVIEQLPEVDTLDELEEYDNQLLEEYHSEEGLQGKEEAEILETRNSSTPIVPVYDADIPQEDIVNSDPIEQGDSVSHVKYGHGIVEKFVKYGSKTLYMINFDMGGRKLLDPLLTEIKKI